MVNIKQLDSYRELYIFQTRSYYSHPPTHWTKRDVLCTEHIRTLTKLLQQFARIGSTVHARSASLASRLVSQAVLLVFATRVFEIHRSVSRERRKPSSNHVIMCSSILPNKNIYVLCCISIIVAIWMVIIVRHWAYFQKYAPHSMTFVRLFEIISCRV